MPNTRSVEPFGDSKRNDQFEAIAKLVADHFGKNGELYVSKRAETAERLGLRRRAQDWRVIEGILRRLDKNRSS